MNRHVSAAAGIGLALAALPTLVSAQALERIQTNGKLVCAVPTAPYLGFLEVDDQGNWQGMDIDVCRAVAVATLGPDAQIEFSALSWADRFTALQSGAVDIVAMATTWTRNRDASQGVQFSLPYYFGGSQLMVHANLGVTEASQLDGATICGTSGSSVERATSGYLTSLGIEYEMLSFENTADRNSAYESERCNVMAGWGPGNAVLRATGLNPDDHVLLPDVISNDPISVAVAQGDSQMLDVVNWTIAAMIAADVFGITSENAAEMRDDPDAVPEVAVLLGAQPGMGDGLGLPDDWAFNVITTVGSYSEVFDRNLGANSPYGLPRGQNQAWTNGGLLWAPLID